ncbi:MAG: glycosyltransferase family 2 protein [Saprospiraceae bacterium]|nr:glycosyltransferase family 2 protein [Saprospiraceae bacterium]
MLLSVICPTLNEEQYIENILRFFVEAHPKEKELLIIDGCSKDLTQQIVRKWQQSYPNIHLLYNIHRYVSFALNIAIPQCKGRYIVRLDAHTEYAPDYFEQILKTFEKTGADIVGGPTRTKALHPTQAAVAYAICTPFGIGNSLVHQEDYEGYTDSVTFGAWKREIFQKTGLFDTSLVRNQDDEFHYRAKSLGFKIYQNPAIKLYYYPRSDLKSLFRQYFQYGLYKPRVLRKVPSEGKLRHWIPSFFTIYVPLAFLLTFAHWLFLGPLLLYFLIDIYFSFFNHLAWNVKRINLLVFPTIHLAYGLGFLKGLLRTSK